MKKVKSYCHPRLPQELGESGATMVEFALASVFLLFIFGAFFDVGLALHNWMLLRHATSEATREVAVRYTTRPYCPAIETFLKDKATPRLRDALGVDVAKGKTHWCVDWIPPTSSSADQFPVLRVKSEIPGTCYFLCGFYPKGFKLSATHEAVIELVNDDNPSGCSENWLNTDPATGNNKPFCFYE